MEEFTRVDIFDTKGMEYLMVIGYLVVLILFWQIAKNPRRIVQQIRDVVHTLSEKILRIPLGLFFNRNHTWAHLGTTGEAKVGMDDFLQRVTGQVRIGRLREPGETIRKGDLLTEIGQEEKKLRIYSPISGEIVQVNPALAEDPGVLNQDPYEKGWIYKIRPSDWKGETGSSMLAEEAVRWSEKEFVRFKDFLTGGPMKTCSSEPSMILLQDGGEIRENVLSDLPGEVWENFQEEFLNAL